MEHPFLNAEEIKANLTLEEIQGKITEVTKRLSFAYSTQKQPLINQLTMVLEVYQRAQAELLHEMFSSDGKDQAGKIDIS